MTGIRQSKWIWGRAVIVGERLAGEDWKGKFRHHEPVNMRVDARDFESEPRETGEL